MLANWRATIGGQRVTSAQIIGHALQHVEFREALLAVAGMSGAVNTQRLGKWLRGNAGKIADGMHIEAGPTRDGSRQWELFGALSAVTATVGLNEIAA